LFTKEINIFDAILFKISITIPIETEISVLKSIPNHKRPTIPKKLNLDKGKPKLGITHSLISNYIISPWE
jgi:hypothetical protein